MHCAIQQLFQAIEHREFFHDLQRVEILASRANVVGQKLRNSGLHCQK